MSEQQEPYITDAMEMMGAGYDQPAAVIDPPRTVKALRDSGLADYKVWGWVKKSAKFISHIKILKGSKLAIWDVISLSIGEDGSCRLSAPEIADLTGYSVSEVRQSIGELDEMGYLSVIRTNGKRNIYKPEFAARGANNPTDNPSKKTTPPVVKVERADDPSSPSIENSAPSISRVKRVKESFSDSNLQGIEVSIFAGRPTTQADIDASNNTSATWRGRELLPPHYIQFGDWWYSQTGMQMYGAKAKAKMDAVWLKELQKWHENDLTVFTLQNAYNHVIAWKKVVSKMSDITATAISMQAAGAKMTSSIPAVKVDEAGFPESY